MKKSDAADPERQTTAPPVGEALPGLSRRMGWAVGSLLVRIVTVAVLNTILAHQIPWLGKNRAFLDALGGILVLWPFFTSWGRVYAWRIALGRTYVREQRWADADQTLSPFLHPRTRLFFDATGEGIYWLATARQALGKDEEARRLLTRLLRERRGTWSERAQKALEEPISGTPTPGAVR
ncbi:MAG: hypothetical protein H7Z41_10180 [Cytophagales bacterium]|nr:hypothetical protein [Armatimonadota bacterium]